MFREEVDAGFHEEIARDHIERGLPLTQLHRNRGVPLASVKKWVSLYREGGRPLLEKAAAEIAKAYIRPLSARQVGELRTQLCADDQDRVTNAIVTVGMRRVSELVDAVFGVFLAHPHAYAISSLFTFADLGATTHLERAALLLGERYSGWVDGARAKLRDSKTTHGL